MFNKLIASSRDKHRAWNPGTVVLSVAAHLLILAVILVLTRPSEEVAPPPPKPEEVTYVDVTEIPPPPEPEIAPEPEPEPVQPTPQPTPPRAAPRQPRNPPPVQRPNEVAGTQELKAPPVVSGIPEPSTVAPPVKAEDFGGRGAIGGTAAGTPPPAPPASTTGTGSGSGGSGSGTSGTYSAAMVDKRAELINREQIAKRLQQLYPPLLRDAGVTGKVTVQMVVGSDGRVDMSTVKIISTSHDAFADVTMQIMKDLRFSPAKMGSTSVRMLTVMPVSWNLNH